MSDTVLEDIKNGVLIDAALPFNSAQGVVQIAEDADWPVRLVAGEYLFNGNCTLLVDDQMFNLNPLGTYETDDYYCRIGIVVTLDAADPSPMLASMTNYGHQSMAIRVQAEVCGQFVTNPHATVDSADPPQLFACGVASFLPPTGGIFVLVDGAKVAFPLKVYMTLTAEKHTRTGYLYIRAGER